MTRPLTTHTSGAGSVSGRGAVTRTWISRGVRRASGLPRLWCFMAPSCAAAPQAMMTRRKDLFSGCDAAVPLATERAQGGAEGLQVPGREEREGDLAHG